MLLVSCFHLAVERGLLNMRRMTLALLVLFSLAFGMTNSVAAQDINCPEVSYERAQEILAQDPSDPHGLDADNDGEACENNARGGGGTTDGDTDDGDAEDLPTVGSGPMTGTDNFAASVAGASALLLAGAALAIRRTAIGRF